MRQERKNNCLFANLFLIDINRFWPKFTDLPTLFETKRRKIITASEFNFSVEFAVNRDVRLSETCFFFVDL